MKSRAVGLLLGYAADRVLGDPQRLHPVAGFGTAAQALEDRLYADSRARGVAHTALLVGGTVALGVLVERRGAARVFSTAVVTWAVLGGRSLEREASAVHTHLMAGDLPAARQRLTHLVGRDTADLDDSEVSRAVIESVAENTSDAVVAPLVWGAVCGVPGLLGYRAVNTLDAMVGHHNTRYENYGWASARLDDLANLPGARLSGLLTMAAAPSRARGAARTWRRDAALHPSPNGGVVESAFAGVLGIRLGGTNTYYGDRIEHRAVMGSGRAARPDDIARSTVLARRIGLGAVVVAALISLRGGCSERPRRPLG
jgi:adenosylcobinamide-phosphate synthase